MPIPPGATSSMRSATLDPPSITESHRVRALVVLAQPPTLEGGAPARGAVALLRGLRANGVEVEALAVSDRAHLDGKIPSDLAVEVVDLPPSRSGVRPHFNRLRYPRGALLGAFAERVRERSQSVDLVHLDETETAWCNAGISQPSSLHVHFRTLRDRRVFRPWHHEFRFVAEFAAAEIIAARRYRFLVATSEEVGRSLRRINRRADVTVVPFSLEPSHYRPAGLDGPPRAGIIGTGDWPPTANAIDRLLGRVWPRVRRLVPEAQLLIAGRATARPDSRSDGAAGVEFLGEVATAPDFLSQLSLLLYPPSRGSGVKVKVLEAMACGVPIVTTPPGAEGVAPNDGILVCGDDDDVATAAARLLVDADERRERGAAARAAFLRDHTPAVATASLVDLFERMLDRRS